MNYKLEDLIDIPLFQELLDRLNEALIFPSAIIDNDSNIITATNWQDICTKFHRANPESEKECRLSDQYILSHIKKGDFPVTYRCPHGLVDNATPIIIEGKHLGNFFIGQLFLEKPDMGFFKEQARKYGFDENSYLDAVSRVPILTRNQLEKNLRFIKSFTEILAAIGLKHLKEKEARKIINEKEERLRLALNAANQGMWDLDIRTGKIVLSQEFPLMLGYSPSEYLLTLDKWSASLHPDDIKKFVDTIEGYLCGEKSGYCVEFRMKTKSGDWKWILSQGKIFEYDTEGTPIRIVGINTDITERKLAEEALKESEEGFRSLFEGSPDAIFLADPETGIIIDANSRASELLERSKEEIKGMHQSQLHPHQHEEYSRETFREHAGKTKQIKEIRPFENIAVRSDGTEVPVEVLGRMVTVNGKPVIQGVFRDITERKRAEDILRKSKESFSKAEKIGHFGYWEWNVATNKLVWSDEVFRIYGLDPKKVIPTYETVVGTLSAETRDLFIKAIDDSLNNNAPFEGEYSLIRPDGTVRYTHTIGEVIRDRDGKPLSMFGVVQDITERKQVEERLQLFRNLLESSNDAIFVNDPETGRILDANDRACVNLGYEREELLNMRVFDFEVTLPDKFSWKEHVKEVQSRGHLILEGRHRRKNSTIVPVEVNISYVVVGKNSYMLAVVRDITERKQAEKALLVSKDFSEKLIDSLADGLSVMNKDGVRVMVNKALCDMTGFSEDELINSKSPFQIWPPEHMKEIEETFKTMMQGMMSETELVFMRKNGERFPVLLSPSYMRNERGEITNYINSIKDITERKHSEEELNKSHNLLGAINRAQSQFITDSDSRIIFDDLINNLLSLTSSQYGLIGEVLHNTKNEPYLKIHSITNIAWNKDMKEFYEKSAPKGMEFHNLKTLFNAVITTGKPIISNNPSSDPRRGGLPEVHPLINSFMGLPLYRSEKLIGLVGIANRPGGYDEELVEYLKPILNTCANIFEAYRNDQKRKQSEEQIKASLKEKEILLREIHHRVKNNMQIISSLLGLQAESIREKKYLDMINDSRNRIMSMYMIHEKLYRSNDLEKIEITKYIIDLTNGLLQSYGVTSSTIELNVKVNDTSLGIDFAIPCGLIINELVTNSLKYAFPDGRKGKINVSLHPLDENMFELVVSDNGAGIPHDVDFRKTESLGLRLVTILAENQLQGKVDLNRNGGTEFTIKFKGVK